MTFFVMEESLPVSDEILKVSDLWVIHCRIIDFRDDTVPQGEPDSARSRVSGSHSVFISMGPSRLDARPSESCVTDFSFISRSHTPRYRLRDEISFSRPFRTQAASSVSLLDAMHCISSFQDLTNDSAPSSRSWATKVSMSMRAFANLASTSSALQARDRELLDVAAERAAGQQTADDVVEPKALAHFVKFLGRFHHFPPEQNRAALVWPAWPVAIRTVETRPWRDHPPAATLGLGLRQPPFEAMIASASLGPQLRRL